MIKAHIKKDYCVLRILYAIIQEVYLTLLFYLIYILEEPVRMDTEYKIISQCKVTIIIIIEKLTLYLYCKKYGSANSISVKMKYIHDIY